MELLDSFICKDFGGKNFFGIVSQIDLSADQFEAKNKTILFFCYHTVVRFMVFQFVFLQIIYEDGDCEDLREKHVRRLLFISEDVPDSSKTKCLKRMQRKHPMKKRKIVNDNTTAMYFPLYESSDEEELATVPDIKK
jgi:hypothetical protein